MLFIIETLFWILIFLPIHSYLLYPVIISAAAARRIKKMVPGKDVPLSVIISAYNEEKVIRDRLENLNRVSANFTNFEVLIGSDCSDDQTNLMLKEGEQKYPWLKVVYFSARRGKAAVINDLVKESRYDLLVFSDANTLFAEDSLNLLAEHFDDPNVGGVSGKLVLREPEKEFNKSIEEKRYWEYETFIKQSEGNCGILIGANGGIFAIRKHLFTDIPVIEAVTDDLYISLSVLRRITVLNMKAVLQLMKMWLKRLSMNTAERLDSQQLISRL